MLSISTVTCLCASSPFELLISRTQTGNSPSRLVQRNEDNKPAGSPSPTHSPNRIKTLCNQSTPHFLSCLACHQSVRLSVMKFSVYTVVLLVALLISGTEAKKCSHSCRTTCTRKVSFQESESISSRAGRAYSTIVSPTVSHLAWGFKSICTPSVQRKALGVPT